MLESFSSCSLLTYGSGEVSGVLLERPSVVFICSFSRTMTLPDTGFSTGCPVVNEIDTMQNFRAHGLGVAKEHPASQHTSPFAIAVGGH